MAFWYMYFGVFTLRMLPARAKQLNKILTFLPSCLTGQCFSHFCAHFLNLCRACPPGRGTNSSIIPSASVSQRSSFEFFMVIFFLENESLTSGIYSLLCSAASDIDICFIWTPWPFRQSSLFCKWDMLSLKIDYLDLSGWNGVNKTSAL